MLTLVLTLMLAMPMVIPLGLSLVMPLVLALLVAGLLSVPSRRRALVIVQTHISRRILQPPRNQKIEDHSTWTQNKDIVLQPTRKVKCFRGSH